MVIEEPTCCTHHKCQTWKATRCDVRGTGNTFFYPHQSIHDQNIAKRSLICLLQVLCASNEDHSEVEPLLPPVGAQPGERVSFSGYNNAKTT